MFLTVIAKKSIPDITQSKNNSGSNASMVVKGVKLEVEPSSHQHQHPVIQQEKADKDDKSPDPIVGEKRDREEAFAPNSSSSKPDLDNCFEEAWKILHTPSFTTDAHALEGLLIEYGLTEKELLPYCEQEDIDKIAQLLKMIPRRKFMDLSKRWQSFNIGNL
jgi:hypothetical protein